MNKNIKLSDGSTIPVLGQGTWHMGEKIISEDKEVSALKYGINKDMTLIDTAEMYGSGGAELLVGKAIKGKNRNKLYIVSKVYPHNAGRDNIFQSCEKSLKRLGTDYLDLYLLHWPGRISLEETVECMEELVKQGKIRRWGVSNFDTGDLEELWKVKNGDKCVVNQVLYHLGSRGIEYDLLPWMEEKDVVAMAYCPLAQGGELRKGLLNSSSVKLVAEKHNISPAQVLLAFIVNRKNMVAIPKSSSKDHIDENSQIYNIKLDNEDIRLLDEENPAPNYKIPLDIV